MKKRVLPVILALAMLLSQLFSFPMFAKEALLLPVQVSSESKSSGDSFPKASFSEATLPEATLPEATLPEASLPKEELPMGAVKPEELDGVYQIGSTEELAWFRDTVNSGNNQINAVLTADIDLNEEEWTPIGGGNGYATTCFKGSFDGDGYTITGVSIQADFNHAGLFGYMDGADAIVQNLSVSGIITSTAGNVGGIVGTLKDGTIRNCSFSGSVTNVKAKSGYAGGIAGYLGFSKATIPTIQGCVNRGTISGPYAGGITGYGKFGTITECYNTGSILGSSRAGGIAGQMQNNFTCSYCYSIGDVSGTTTLGEITDFLFSSATLSHCGYAHTLFGAGAGTEKDCFQFTTPNELLAGLGNAFVANGEDYPVLAWEAGNTGEPEPLPDPGVVLQGIDTIFVEQGATPNQATITMTLQDIKEEDITDITWQTTVLKGSLPLAEMVSVSYPENNDKAVILSALTGGGVIQVEASVTVGDATYTDTLEVSVIPQITFAEVVNADKSHGVYPVLGELAAVKIYTLGGSLYDFENYPALNFKWRYPSPTAADIGGVTGREYLIPNDGSLEAGNYIYVEILSGEKVLRNAMDTRGLLAAKGYESPDTGYVEDASSIFDEGYGPLKPIYGTDKNIIDMITSDLVKANFPDISVTIKSIEEVYAGGSLQQDGSFDFFYADPNTPRALWWARYRVAVTLTKGEASTVVEDLLVDLPWDSKKVEEVMRAEILPGVTENILLGDNDRDNITMDLVLPKVVDEKMWTQIEWTSSDSTVVSISRENQGTADTLFDPYVGKVIRGEHAKTVTLTAKFKFQFTAMSEPDITLYKTFTFTIPPLSNAEVDALRAELLEKIDTGVASAGFLDYVTRESLVPIDDVYTICNDIQYPTTRDFGVDGKYFPVTISSSNEEVIESPGVANGARSFVYRPLPDGSATEVDVTITITNSAKGISASRIYTFQVKPFTQTELDSALSLMELVSVHYFDGLNNAAYEDYDSVSGKLSPFMEATWDLNKDSIRWIYTNDERASHGIISDEIDGWEDQEAWRAFRSSDPTILDHETLNFTKPTEDTFVRISSSLTHSILGKYWIKFEGVSGYEVFKSLYRQPVCEYVMVEGINHVERTAEELAALREQAIANIETPISATLILADFEAAPQQSAGLAKSSLSARANGQLLNTTVSNLTAGTTVFGLFRKVMAEQNYTYTAAGSYIKSITDSNGNTLAELDGGPNSGWIYTVNGAMPLVYMNGYTLKQGDVVEIKYTTDYTDEPGAELPDDPSEELPEELPDKPSDKPSVPEKPSLPMTPDTPDISDTPDNSGAPDNSDSLNTSKPMIRSDSVGETIADLDSLENTPEETSAKSLDDPGSAIESGSTSGDLSLAVANNSGKHAVSASGDSTEASEQASASEDFDDTYIEDTIAQNKDSQNPVMSVVLVLGIVVFLIVSGTIYTKFIKKRES